MKLSIIIPYHDSLTSVLKLIESVPQDDRIEIIIVNDHSNCIADYISKFFNVRYYTLPKGKRWAGAARNFGIEKSTGDYLLFADADDYFVSGAFDVINSYIPTEHDIIYFSPTSIKPDGSISSRHLPFCRLVDDFIMKSDPLIRYKHYVPWSKLINREFILQNNIRFDEVIASNDINFSLKLGYYAKSIHATKDIIYCVTDTSNSLTKQTSEEVLNSRFDAAARYNDFLIEHNINHQLPMQTHLINSFKVSWYKFLSDLFRCKHYRYKIFYSPKDIFKKISNR